MNVLYDVAAYKLMLGQLPWPTTEMVLLVWGGVPVYDATHNSVATIRAAAGAGELGVSLAITERAVASDGTGQTNQVVVPGIPATEEVTWMTLCQENANPDARMPILFIDEAFNLPFYSNGLDMIIQPDWVTLRGWFRP